MELTALNDDELWWIVFREFDLPLEMRLHELATVAELRHLTETEKREYRMLTEEYDEFLGIRHRALHILKQRGHDVESRMS